MLALVNGDVTVCCADFNGLLVVGSVLDQSLEEIWQGEPYRKIRRLMKEGRFDQLPAICGDCLMTQELKMKALTREIHKMYREARKEESL